MTSRICPQSPLIQSDEVINIKHFHTMASIKQTLRKCFLPKFKYFLDSWILSLSVEKVHVVWPDEKGAGAEKWRLPAAAASSLGCWFSSRRLEER